MRRMLLRSTGSAVDLDSFLMTVTTGASATFQLNLNNSGTYNFVIDWGDGSTDTITAWNQAELVHDYSLTTGAGTYQIAINGICTHIYFNGGGDILKVDSIDQWGTIAWGSMFSAFDGCSNMTANFTDAPDLSSVTTCREMFLGCSSFDADLSSWDVSNVQDFSQMFQSCSVFNNGGVALNWNTSSATNMKLMFRDASIFNQRLTLVTTNVTDMSSMFFFARDFNNGGFTTGGIVDWDVSNLQNTAAMFYFASDFDQNLGAWDIQSLTNATNMFLSMSLSTSNYDSLLVGWEANLQATYPAGAGYTPTISAHFGSSTYTLASAAATARALLISTFGWTITDGGGV